VALFRLTKETRKMLSHRLQEWVFDGLVVLDWRGCFAGVAGDLLSVGARK